MPIFETKGSAFYTRNTISYTYRLKTWGHGTNNLARNGNSLIKQKLCDAAAEMFQKLLEKGKLGGPGRL